MNTRIIMALALACVACQKPGRTLPYYDSADFTPRWETPANGAGHTVRPFSLVSQEDSTFTEQDIKGKVAVVSFFFASCSSICPNTTKSLMAIQQEFLNDDNVILLSHSVTPRHDSVPVLQEFARDKHVIAKRWKLLTGSEKEIYDLGRHYYFLDDDQGKERSDALFSHTENFVLVDQQRRLRGIYNGQDPSSMQDLVRDIRLLQQSP